MVCKECFTALLEAVEITCHEHEVISLTSE
jgi:hypothetical protein